MKKVLRQLFAYAFVYSIAGCSGGACSSCAGGAITPIAGGYPIAPETRVPRSMQVRLTQQGLAKVQAIAPSLFAGFLMNGVNVPTTSSSGTPSITVCDRPPAGGCNIAISLNSDPNNPGLQLSFAAPNQIAAIIRLVLVDHDLPINTLGCNLHLDLDTTRGNYPFVGLSTNIAIARDTHAPRLDYHAASLVSPTGSGSQVQETPNEGIEDADFTLASDETGCSFTNPGQCIVVAYCAGLSAISNLSFVQNILVGQISGQIQQAVGPIQDELAAASMPNPPGCPTGTTVNGAYCSYSDNSQVPALLGTEGHGNFGVLLGGLTPGVTANDSYIIASGDHVHDAQVLGTGMSIDVFGAVSSGGHNTCVPMLPAPPIPTIPEWMTFQQDLIPGTMTTTDLGIGIAQDFLNSAMFNLWDSGLFCLGVNTRLSQQLATGLFTALPQLSSLKNVIFPLTTSPAALLLRPQQPPAIVVGTGANLTTNPLLLLTFQQLAIDFYAWSEERYVRFMTVNTNLTLPLNLMMDSTGLQPVLGMATTSNTTITNSQLLTSTPTTIASVLNTLLGTAIGMFAGSLPSIAIPTIAVPGTGGTSAGSIQIQIPAMGIQGLSENGSNFLALFANLQYTPPVMMQTLSISANAQAMVLPYDPRVYEFAPSFEPTQLPRVHLTMGTADSFGHPIEFTYRVDAMTWSQWTQQTVVDVQSSSFIAQGAHHIEVRARVVDQPQTVSSTPARVDFNLDPSPPVAVVDRSGTDLIVTAHDNVSPVERLQYNFVFDQADNAAWTINPNVRIPPEATQYTVRVRDEAGNISINQGDIVGLTIRGGPSTDPSACGCSTPGAGGQGAGSLIAFLMAVVGALSLLRRRPQLAPVSRGTWTRVATSAESSRLPRLLLWSMIPLFFVALGCNCGANNQPDASMGPDTSAPVDAFHMAVCQAGQTYCHSQNICVTDNATCNNVQCPVGQAVSGMPNFVDSTCTWDMGPGPTACDCTPLPPLKEGMAGSHLDMAVGANNTIWFSAYSAGDVEGELPYGDLIVGTWSTTTMSVNWTQVDGVPTPGTITGDINGWRGGNSAAGPDVGRWNSIALDSMGHPRVSYWDTTNDQLKFASYNGTTWSVSVVDTHGHAGRYTSLVMLPNDIPAIAYRVTQPDAMTAGQIDGIVRFAKANNSTPQSPTDWVTTNIASVPTSCRAADCAAGQVCLSTTGRCVATSGTCTAACSAAQACVASACVAIYTPGWIEDYPPGIGLFNSLTVDSMNNPQLAYYDRDRGNLMGTSLMGTTWQTPFIIDGQAADGTDTGDRGMWASLVVTPDNVWHLGYVDAYAESVLYTTVTAGVPATSETADPGSGLAPGMLFTDGNHIIGDSISLNVDSTGTVRMVYEDSTVQSLRLAVRGATAWTLSTVDTTNSTGYWSRISKGEIATFWRDLHMFHFGVRVFPVP